MSRGVAERKEEKPGGVSNTKRIEEGEEVERSS